MRRQDELLILYRGQDPLTRKYTLTQVESLSLAFDSEELLEFLQGELGDTEAVIHDQVLFTLSRFLPGFIHKRYSLAQYALGIWSTFGQNQANVKGMVSQAKEMSAIIARRRQVGYYLARPLGNSLAAAASRVPAPLATATYMALGNMPLDPCRAVLRKSVADAPAKFVPLLAFASMAETAEDHDFLSRAIAAGAAQEPDLLLLLAYLPGEASFPFLMDRIDSTTTLGRINIAAALGRIDGIDHRAAVESLVSHKEGWVTLQALRALELTGALRYLPVVQGIFQQTRNEFVRGHAIRAAGGLYGKEAVDFCLGALKLPSATITAQALESLVRLHCPLEVLRNVGGPLLKSPSLKARVNALLAVADPADADHPPLLQDMLLSTDPVERLEAAYCLGYLQSQVSLTHLVTLASLDPSLHVRLQAVKSLSKYPARSVLPCLLELTADPETRVSLTAARVLTRYADVEAVLICDTIKAAIGKIQKGFRRALLYRAFGALARKAQVKDPEVTLIRGLEEKDAKVVLGAVEGWTNFGMNDAPEARSALVELSQSREPRVRARALLALFNTGHLEAVEPLAKLLAAPDSDGAGPALETALEIGLILSRVDLDNRFPLLEARLDQAAGTPEIQAHLARTPVPTVKSRGPGERAPGDEPEVRDEFAVRRAQRAIEPVLPGPEGGDKEEPGARVASPATGTSGDAPRSEPGRPGSGRLRPTREPEAPEAAPPRPAAGTSQRVATGRAPSSRLVAGQLRQLLARPDVARLSHEDQVSVQLRRVTYLITDQPQEPTVWDKARPFRMLIATGALVLGVLLVLLVAAFRRVGPVDSGPAPDLALAFYTGTLQIEPRGAGPRLGGELRKDMVLVTGPDSSARITAGRAGLVSMGAATRLTVERSGTGGRDVSVEVDRGEYTFDFRKGGSVQVTIGPFTVKGSECWFTLEPGEKITNLVVESGGVEVARGSAASRNVSPGELLKLE